MKAFDYYGDPTLMKAVLDELILGHGGNNISLEEQKIIDSMDWIKEYMNKYDFPFLEFVRQKCAHFFLRMQYKDRERIWSELPEEVYDRTQNVWGPHFYGTDYGACCIFNGQVGMDPWPEGITEEEVSYGFW